METEQGGKEEKTTRKKRKKKKKRFANAGKKGNEEVGKFFKK
jgi:hypothetical protein